MSLTNFTLLYVEDDRESQKHMKMILQDRVKEFYQAYDGEEGLSIFKEKKPDIILADINMPILNGLSMVKKIREINSHTPIVLISAFDDKSYLLQAIELNIDYFISKPIDIDILDNGLDCIVKKLQNRINIERENKEDREHLYKLAHFDSLTNLPNRLLFNKKLDEALEKAENDKSVVALFFVDLDRFKNINDTYGHAAGDEVLKIVSQSVQKCIRSEDIFFRISGDEFSLILEETKDKDSIELISEKILKATSTSINFKGHKINVTCSIGISRFPQDTKDKKELLHFADMAMYKSKEIAKASYMYYKDLGK